MGLYHSPRIVTNGLVLALDAADRNSYVSGSTTWYDLSGNNNNVSLLNGPTFLSTNGGMISFDGVNDAGLITANGSPLFTGNIANAYTIFSIFENLNTDGTWHHFFGFNDSGTNIDEWYNGPSLSGAVKGAYHNNSGQMINSTTTTIATGVNCWCHSYSTGNNLLYKNGTLDISNSGTNILTPSGNFGIARDPETSTYWSRINISVLTIYNRQLSVNEIQQNFNALRGRFGI